MPTSNINNIIPVLGMARASGAKTALDVGPGHGKYGVLLREYAGVKDVDAVELWDPYVDDFGLRGIYREVILGNALELTEEQFDPYDLVLIIGTIEHFDKELAVDMLKRIRGHVVIATPRSWMQQDHPIPTERHRSLWAVRDFERWFPDRLRANETQTNAVSFMVHLGGRSR